MTQAEAGRLRGLLGRTSAFYERYLWESREGAQARSYLKGRGLTEQSLRAFHVGYAPRRWDTVVKNSTAAGYDVSELYTVGLASEGRNGQPYDRFRERITFPITDGAGRLSGFGARAMDSSTSTAKYINTAKSPLFSKRKIVYGADRARAAAQSTGSVVVCEGYTDVIALHQAGVHNAVASMGTSLTDDQLQCLRSLAPIVHLALDADSAGQEAMLRVTHGAARSGLHLRVVPLPEGSDPADVAANEGPESVREMLGRSVPFARYMIERILDEADLSSAEKKDAAIARMVPTFSAIAPGEFKDEMLNVVSMRMEIPSRLVRELLG